MYKNWQKYRYEPHENVYNGYVRHLILRLAKLRKGGEEKPQEEALTKLFAIMQAARSKTLLAYSPRESCLG